MRRYEFLYNLPTILVTVNNTSLEEVEMDKRIKLIAVKLRSKLKLISRKRYYVYRFEVRVLIQFPRSALGLLEICITIPLNVRVYTKNA